MEERISVIEAAVTRFSGELQEVGRTISSGFTKVNYNFDSVKKEIDLLHLKVDSMHKKMDALNKKVDSLEGNTSDGFDSVGIKLENLSDEISKIGVDTRYKEEFDNLKGFTN